MFKTTGVASDIADKQIVIDLLRCYNELGAFDNSMSLYYDQRMQAILPEQMGETLWSADTNIGKAFGRMLTGKKVQNWLGMIPRAFDTRYFEVNEEKLEAMIAKLENATDRSDGGQHRTSRQQQQERGEKQQSQNGDQSSDTTPSLSAAGQRVGQQGNDQSHQRGENHAYQKSPAETDASVAADDAHQHGEETAAQNSE